jgi:hypothetical protein
MRPRGETSIGARHESLWGAITLRGFVPILADCEVITCHPAIRCHTAKQSL